MRAAGLGPIVDTHVSVRDKLSLCLIYSSARAVDLLLLLTSHNTSITSVDASQRTTSGRSRLATAARSSPLCRETLQEYSVYDAVVAACRRSNGGARSLCA